jgi:hypothetical protein
MLEEVIGGFMMGRENREREADSERQRGKERRTVKDRHTQRERERERRGRAARQLLSPRLLSFWRLGLGGKMPQARQARE